MSIVYYILDEHSKLLTQKGYDEVTLNNGDKPGWLMDELRRNIGWALKESLLDEGTISFSLRTTGFFNEDKDIVTFYFMYEFDPDAATLDLKELRLVHEKTTYIKKLSAKEDLQHSREVFTLLQQQYLNDQARNARFIPVYASRQAKGKDDEVARKIRR